MLFAANYILNVVDKKEEWEIYPFIHNHNNVANEKDLFQNFRIPDILPSQCIHTSVDFSMVAGEFVEIYKMQKGCDCNERFTNINRRMGLRCNLLFY